MPGGPERRESHSLELELHYKRPTGTTLGNQQQRANARTRAQGRFRKNNAYMNLSVSNNPSSSAAMLVAPTSSYYDTRPTSFPASNGQSPEKEHMNGPTTRRRPSENNARSTRQHSNCVRPARQQQQSQRMRAHN